jgi:hypothetical protein
MLFYTAIRRCRAYRPEVALQAAKRANKSSFRRWFAGAHLFAIDASRLG